jgi:hypothetical protein
MSTLLWAVFYERGLSRENFPMLAASVLFFGSWPSTGAKVYGM